LVFRRGSLGLALLATVALVAVYAAVCFVFLFAFSPAYWATGALVTSVGRAMSGGHYYETTGSLLGPTWPYFPLSPLLTRAACALGVPLLSAPALLGGIAAFVLPLSAAALARVLGARWLPSLCVSFALYGLILPRYRILLLLLAAFYPDALAPALLILGCLSLELVERAGNPWKRVASGWVGALWTNRWTVVFGLSLVAAGLSKQLGLAGVAGAFVYLGVFSRSSWPTRRSLMAVVVLAGVVVALIVLAMPGCFELTVSVLSRQAKDWKRLEVLWQYLFNRQLPSLIVYLVSLPVAMAANARVRRTFLHLHCVLLPVLALQVLATVKDGGGGENDSYNMETVFSLWLPVAVWACAARLSEAQFGWQAAAMALLSGLAMKSMVQVWQPIWDGRRESWTEQKNVERDVAQIGTPGKVLCHENYFWALEKAGYRIGTGTAALWEYSDADPEMKNPAWIKPIEIAIQQRQYVLISPGWSNTIPRPVVQRLSPLIDANYVQVKPGWLAPRPR